MIENAFYFVFLIGVIVGIGWVIATVLIAFAGVLDRPRHRTSEQKPITYPCIVGTDEGAVWANEISDWDKVYVKFGDGRVSYMRTEEAKKIAVDAR